MSDDTVKLVIDGHTLEAAKGATVIQVADEAGIYIPRFCYHRRLKIVANCRMCLVDIEGAPKPSPACSTPVAEGMVVQTRSQRALDAQRATMEFLLINHPLDCPVCDQGGECELQDLAMGFGRGVSRFTERKRSVADKSFGPLVRPEMTRCIHCTRCIRVLEEVAGRQELGATGRGEHMRIGTYIERGIDSELSGNIIDVCPVGALNSGPFDMAARGWELLAHKTVGAHDCVGSNLYGHSLRGRFMRVVPRENEAINDCWISDRDRFSYTGLDSDERVRRPLVRRDGRLVEVEWEEALPEAARILAAGGNQLAALVSPNATLEEMYLVQKLVRGLGSGDIDARLRQADFRDDAGDPRYPSLGCAIDRLEQADAILLVGSRINKEAPILGYRLRRAADRGAAVMALNPRRFDLVVPLTAQKTVHPDELAAELAALARAVARASGRPEPDFLGRFPALHSEETDALAARLVRAEHPHLLLGHLALRHPAFADLRRLAAAVAELAEGGLGFVTEGANAAGAYLAGAVPHRGPGGVPVTAGAHARAMLESPRPAYLLFGAEPESDCWDGAAALASLGQSNVVAVTAFLSAQARAYADCVLPLASFGETPGSYVNGAGTLQAFDAVSVAPGQSRPGWKILRALGGALGPEAGFDFTSLAEVRGELMNAVGPIDQAGVAGGYTGSWQPGAGAGERPSLRAIVDVGLYAVDGLVRRARPLQETPDGRCARKVWLNPDDAAALDLGAGDAAHVAGAGGGRDVEVDVDPGIVRGTVWLPATAGAQLWDEVSVAALPRAEEA